MSSPVVAGGRVYASCGAGLLSFGAADGSERWRLSTPGDRPQRWNQHPVVVDGLAFLTTSYNRVYAVESCTVGGGRYCLF